MTFSAWPRARATAPSCCQTTSRSGTARAMATCRASDHWPAVCPSDNRARQKYDPSRRPAGRHKITPSAPDTAPERRTSRARKSPDALTSNSAMRSRLSWADRTPKTASETVWLGKGTKGTAPSVPSTSTSMVARLFDSSPSTIALRGSTTASKACRPPRSLRRQSAVMLSRVPNGGSAAMNRVSTEPASRLRSMMTTSTVRSGKSPQLPTRRVTRTESAVLRSPRLSRCMFSTTRSGPEGRASCCAGSPMRFIVTKPNSLEGRAESSVIFASARLCPKAKTPFSNVW